MSPPCTPSISQAADYAERFHDGSKDVKRQTKTQGKWQKTEQREESVIAKAQSFARTWNYTLDSRHLLFTCGQQIPPMKCMLCQEDSALLIGSQTRCRIAIHYFISSSSRSSFSSLKDFSYNSHSCTNC